MSRENVEVVRQALELLRESYDSGNATDGLLELCTDDVRVDARRRVFNPAVYDGAEGMRRTIQEICDAWEDFGERDGQLIDAGDRVVVIHTIGGRGRISGVRVELRGALIFTVRDRLIASIEVFVDPDEARKSVGLED